MDATDVDTVSEARARLTSTLARMRRDPSAYTPRPFGTHRRPEAVVVPYDSYVALRRSAGGPGTPIPLLDEVLRRRGLILRLARVSHIRRVSVFGSAARGEEGPESDVDLLVEPDDEATLFDFAQFAADVELLLGRSADVVSRGALDPARPTDRRVLDEAVPL